MFSIEVMLMSFIELFRIKYRLYSKLSVGVLVSGGVDSIALLHVLNKYKNELELNLTILHRKFDDFPSHKHVEELINKLSKQYNIPVITEESNISVASNVKETARKEMKELALKDNFDIVLSGHHADDQIETILFRLMRGSGLEGLKGMDSISEFYIGTEKRIFGKPFLDVKKTEIRNYVKENKLQYVDDETNLNSDSDRNYIRNKVIPVLEKRFNLDNLISTANLVRQQVERFKEETTVDIYSGKWFLNQFINLSIANRVFVVKEFCRKKYGFNFNKRHYKALTEVFAGDLSHLNFQINNSIYIKRSGDYVVIEHINN